jgi:DNA-binding NtrC family response regulator
MPAKLLIIDDDHDILDLLQHAFEDRDFEILLADDSQTGLEIIREQRPNVAIIDINLPGKSGLEILKEIKEIDLGITAIITTGENTTQNAIEAMKLGAYDYLVKPFEIFKMQAVVDKGLISNLLSRKVKFSRTRKDFKNQLPNEDIMIGSSPEMVEIWKMVGKIADSDETVLIHGDSGTGKELLARAIYNNSTRKNRPFLALNCAALPETLLESELFGHERGAFTDAHSRRVGKFEQCNGGTILLDEISEMSLASQGKLLRVLENQSFQRVGGNEEITTDVRIIAAANKNLLDAVRLKKFRLDLFYRLRVISFHLPTLRERPEDIPLLVDLFIRQYAAKYNKKPIVIAPETLQMLASLEWEGNIRELKNAISAAVVFSTEEVLLPSDFSQFTQPVEHKDHLGISFTEQFKKYIKNHFPELCRGQAGSIFPLLCNELEETLVDLALTRCKNNQVAAAKLLGISRNTLRKRLERTPPD